MMKQLLQAGKVRLVYPQGRTGILCLLLVGLLMISGCGALADANPAGAEETDTVPVILDQEQYLLYQNTFYNGYADSFVGATEKVGIYSTIQDAWNNRTRYYVWGFLDQTKCCDWQWEFVPAEGTVLPQEGSQIRVKGNFEKDEAALDGYWIQNATVETEKKYTGEIPELSMLTMSDTLERVQVLNIMAFPEVFEGKNFSAYARISGVDKVEDPYYNDAWNIAFSTDMDIPAIGTMVSMRGIVRNGALCDSALEVIEQP